MPPHKTGGLEPGQAPYFVRSNGRGRPTTSKSAKAVQASPPGPARPPRLTGRGGVLLIVLCSFVGTMLANLLSAPAVPGIAFTLACLVTAVLVRPRDLLSLSVSPPIAYFLAVVGAESMLAAGNDGFTRTLLLGLASRLAEVAPWLFLGTALVLVVAVFRGLPGNLRTLGEELNGRG